MQYFGWIMIPLASLDVKLCPLAKEMEQRKQINQIPQLFQNENSAFTRNKWMPANGNVSERFIFNFQWEDLDWILRAWAGGCWIEHTGGKLSPVYGFWKIFRRVMNQFTVQVRFHCDLRALVKTDQHKQYKNWVLQLMLCSRQWYKAEFVLIQSAGLLWMSKWH